MSFKSIPILTDISRLIKERKKKGYYSCSAEKYVISLLKKNISILINAKVIDDDIDKIEVGITESIERGMFSLNSIKKALYKYEGTSILVKALVIAVFENKWEEKFSLYFKENENKIQKKNIPVDIKPFDTSKGSYNILILPFRNPEKNNEITYLGEYLAKGLKEKDVFQHLGLEIIYLSSFTDDISYEDAKKIGSEYKANMVLWGNDAKHDRSISHIICFHYMIIEENFSLVGKTDKFKTELFFDIKEGNLHLEIDDIIFWVLGHKYYIKCDYKKALTNLKKIKSKKHQNVTLYFYIAICNYYLHSFEEAEECFEKAIELKPDYAEAYYNYAILLAKEMKNIEKANECFEKAIELKPNLAEAHYNYALLLSEELNNKEKSEYHYKKAIEFKPDYASAYNNYALLLSDKFNDNNSAKKCFEKAIELKPDYAEAYYNYAAILLEKVNNKKKAKEYLLKAIKYKPDFTLAHYGLGILFVTEFNNIRYAKKHLEKAIELKPDYAEAYNAYAAILAKESNNKEKAKECFEKAIELKPDFAEAYYNYATLYKIEFKDKKNAKKHYIEAIRLNPKLKTKNRDNYFGVK